MGKSTLVKKLNLIPSSGIKLIYWDTQEDIKDCKQFKRPSEFLRNLIKAEKSGKKYRISYTGDDCLNLFEDVCSAVYEILDGDIPTYFGVSEYAMCCRGAGPLSTVNEKYHKKQWQESRKYNGRLRFESQRPAAITKDAIGNAGVIYAGNMDLNAAKSVGNQIGVKPDEILRLGKGEFYKWKVGGEAEKINIFT